jgi:FixJ family two-component response regulator
MAHDSTDALIAVVDDDRRVLESLENLLESAGFAVSQFTSARALLQASRLGEMDCVVSDINMPDIDGLELSRLLRAARPGLPIILITGHPELLRGSLEETDHFRLFTKPYDPDELLGAIGEMLAN